MIPPMNWWCCRYLIVGRSLCESKVGEWYAIEPNTGCWLWLRAVNHAGYGTMQFRGASWLAHRAFYTIFRGPIGDLSLDHLCRQHCCVNPDHLEAVPIKVNILRGYNRAALQARQTHCINGHEFTPENTISRSGGKRRGCRACKNANGRKHYVRKRPAPLSTHPEAVSAA